VHDGETVEVDLSNAQMQNLAHFQYWYVPAAQVRPRMEAWLARSNRVGRDSKLIDILDLYRDFIVIHPFGDGNGTVSKILLDVMLRRAGFPPAKHSLELSKKVVLSSRQDFLTAFLEAQQ
jgi:Fic family protein